MVNRPGDTMSLTANQMKHLITRQDTNGVVICLRSFVQPASFNVASSVGWLATPWNTVWKEGVLIWHTWRKLS